MYNEGSDILELRFDVNKQIIKRMDKEIPVSKSQNFIKAKFEFSDEWDNLSKRALFQVFQMGEYKTYAVTLENNKCTVPWEALLNREVLISVVGVSEDGFEIITANQVTVYLQGTGYTTHLTSTQDPSQDAFTIILEKLDSKIDDVKIEENYIKFYSKNKVITTIPMNSFESNEVDPIFSSSVSKNISAQDVTNWNNKIDIDDLENEYLNLENYILG